MIGQYAWIYQGMMQLLLKMHRSTPNAGYDKKLLCVVSRNQSRIFSELMLKTDAFGALRNPKVREALAKESEAKDRWVKKRYALASIAQGLYSQQKRKALVKQVESAERQYKLSVRKIHALFPHLMELRSPNAVTVMQVQHDLRQGESVVVYALLEKEILLFVINRKEFHLFPVDTGRKELTGLVHQLRRGVDGGYGLHGLKRLNPKLLHRAYNILLQPAEQMLNGTDLLYIVGDGALYTLPFEMLLKTFDASAIKDFKQQQSTSGDGVLFQEYAGLNYVSWPITYMPSLSSLRVLKKKQKGHYDKNLIAFANPAFFAGTSLREREKYIQKRPLLRSLLRSPDGNSVVLNSLPNTEGEVREVADVLGGRNTLFFGKQARESVLYQTDLTENRYLIFATHGLLGSDFSLPGAEPSLALTMDNALHEGEDGLLSMSEVLNLKINSELVALSACNTSGEISRAQNGEGFAGLTRAFMYAGAHKLLVSHWSVETHSTQDFMRRFFAAMSTGDTPYRALKRARKNLRSSYFDIEGRKVSGAHPFFWAPFVLVGVQ